MTPSRPQLPHSFRFPSRQATAARPHAPRNLRFASGRANGDRPLDAFNLPPSLRALVWPFDSLGVR